MNVLVIAEHDNTTVKGATLNTVSAALQCGEEVHVRIAGSKAGGAVGDGWGVDGGGGGGGRRGAGGAGDAAGG